MLAHYTNGANILSEVALSTVVTAAKHVGGPDVVPAKTDFLRSACGTA